MKKKLAVFVAAFTAVMAFGTGTAFAQTASDLQTAAGWRSQAVKVVQDNVPEIGLTILAVAAASIVLFVGRMGIQLAFAALKARGKKVPV